MSRQRAGERCNPNSLLTIDIRDLQGLKSASEIVYEPNTRRDRGLSRFPSWCHFKRSQT